LDIPDKSKHRLIEMTRRWAVVRIDDEARMGRYGSEGDAHSAARRFGQDGCVYSVVEEIAPAIGAAGR
jgi:hypothetical protein